MKLQLPTGEFVFFDREDAALIRRYRWTKLETSHNIYAVARGSKGTVYMHRLLLKVKDDLRVDHRDGNGLNNRRRNLRKATSQQNNQNAKARRSGSSKYKGVFWSNSRQIWRIQIQTVEMGKRKTYSDRSTSEVLAAYKYDVLARKYFGEFARLNFPREGELSAVK
jgi:G3E family GTPase